MKQAIVFLIWFISFVTLSAQEGLGLKVGLNFSELISNPNFSSDAAFESSLNSFYQLGIQYARKNSEKHRLSVDATFQVMGGKVAITDYCDGCHQVTITHSHTYKYITASAKYHYQLLPTLGIGLGPKLAFLIDGNDIPDFDPNVPDIGIEVSGLFNLNKHFAFELNYYWGLNTVRALQLTDIGDTEPTNLRLQNRSIQFSILYFLMD